jgi:hypothetical protein
MNCPVTSMSLAMLVNATALLFALIPVSAAAAPPTPQRLPLQGVARDGADALIPSGDVAVRIFPDSLGGASLYDSGSEFAGAIDQGIFDIVVGQTTPVLLDQEQSYFLEIDVAGNEIVGDAAGGRWKFYPGGGSHARTDLEARLSSLEAAVGATPASPATRRAALTVAATTSAATSTHALLALGSAAGSSAGFSAQGNLLVQPVGPRAAGGLQVELGPYYLFAPSANPEVRFIRDVPGDQGRSVRVRWRSDLRERPYNAADTKPRITSYTLYRQVGPGQAAALRARPEPDAIALPPGDWDVLTSIPATLDSAYQTVVQTLCDSTSTGTCWSVFIVRSITDQPGTFFNSPVDSGYSVDNLAPGVPSGLTLQSVAGGTALSWQPSPAPDFQYFRVYRDADPEFSPGPVTLVHATETTQWTDPAPGSFTYKLTAVDFNGNESAPAAATITTDVDRVTPTVFGFASVAPNPFRGSMTFVIDVPEASGVVHLEVFDLAGRKIRTIVRTALPAGRHTFSWDGSAQDGRRLAAGVYVARLIGAGRALTRRTTLLP